MATVQELSVLHRRYADLSHRFRAGWTFHQFLQSLGKSLLQRAEDSHSAAFQDLYTELKEISQSLNASEERPHPQPARRDRPPAHRADGGARRGGYQSHPRLDAAVLPPHQDVRRQDPHPARQVLPLRPAGRPLAAGPPRQDRLPPRPAERARGRPDGRDDALGHTAPHRDLPGPVGACWAPRRRSARSSRCTAGRSTPSAARSPRMETHRPAQRVGPHPHATATSSTTWERSTSIPTC